MQNTFQPGLWHIFIQRHIKIPAEQDAQKGNDAFHSFRNQDSYRLADRPGPLADHAGQALGCPVKFRKGQRPFPVNYGCFIAEALFGPAQVRQHRIVHLNVTSPVSFPACF